MKVKVRKEVNPLGYDILIKGGILVDGTGNPWIGADVGVRNGKIAKVGRIEGEQITS